MMPQYNIFSITILYLFTMPATSSAHLILPTSITLEMLHKSKNNKGPHHKPQDKTLVRNN
jgi:hypothetical protein